MFIKHFFKVLFYCFNSYILQSAKADFVCVVAVSTAEFYLVGCSSAHQLSLGRAGQDGVSYLDIAVLKRGEVCPMPTEPYAHGAG